jgi:hypothetical protein
MNPSKRVKKGTKWVHLPRAADAPTLPTNINGRVIYCEIVIKDFLASVNPLINALVSTYDDLEKLQK